MGVDYYTCKNCGENFPDCGDYVSCESCFAHWCSNECAKEDGHIKEHCRKYPELDDRDLMEEYRENHCDCEDCCDCEYYEPESCKYCRHEDYEDDILLDKALGLLNMSRDDLVDKINKDSGKF